MAFNIPALQNINSIGAEVYLDDYYMGMIGQRLEDWTLPSVGGLGKHSLKIKKEGYSTEIYDLYVDGGYGFPVFVPKIRLEPSGYYYTPYLVLAGLGLIGLVGYAYGRRKK